MRKITNTEVVPPPKPPETIYHFHIEMTETERVGLIGMMLGGRPMAREHPNYRIGSEFLDLLRAPTSE